MIPFMIGKELNNEIIHEFLEDIENSSYSKLKSKFKDRFYIEIQRHNDQNEISFEKFNLEKSSNFEIPLIATNETFYW